MVPAMRVLMWVSSSSFSFAKPKSEILALSSLSSNTLLVLISLCTIFIIDSSCRYIKPLATPRQIFCLVGQSSFILNLDSFPEIMGKKNDQFLNPKQNAFVQNASDRRKKLTHREEHGISNYFPCTHIQSSIGFLQHNIHTTLQDSDVAVQISFLSHSQIHDFLAWILRRVA